MDRIQLEHEARAKIFWGDPPETVIHHLQVNGVSLEEAEALTDGMFRERIRAVRGLGLKRIVIGLLMMTVPLAYWWIAHAILLSVWILGVTGAVGLFGAWKVLQGAIAIIFPENEEGDLAEES